MRDLSGYTPILKYSLDTLDTLIDLQLMAVIKIKNKRMKRRIVILRDHLFYIHD